MPRLDLPLDVEQVFREFRTCEFTTLASDGTPITWPLIALFQPDSGQFLLATSIGTPRKVQHIRRDARVALLFSDPTASGLKAPPAALVQGDAEVSDQLAISPASMPDLREFWLTVFRRQPSGIRLARDPLTRSLLDWYYMRYLIRVTPQRILWWPAGDFSGQHVALPQGLKSPDPRASANEFAATGVPPGSPAGTGVAEPSKMAGERGREMWDELVKHLGRFQSAVLTGVDGSGYPFSIRCQPRPDALTQTLRLDLPDGVLLQPGPASLLCHRHDERTWGLDSFLARGALARDEQGWAFRPRQNIPGMRNKLTGLPRVALEARATARRHLKARGLPRPRIPWAEFDALKNEARKERRG